MEFLVKSENLSIGYEHIIQSDLNFKISEGEILLVKGKNGSGKSTLIKTLIQEIAPKEGQFHWGIDKGEISILPQLTHHEFPLSVTLKEILDLYDLSDEVKALLPATLLNRRFNDGSGGEKQKALVLTRLRDDAKFLILDEPFNHLDQSVSQDIMNFISELIKKKILKGAILITHLDIKINDLKIKELVLS